MTKINMGYINKSLKKHPTIKIYELFKNHPYPYRL